MSIWTYANPQKFMGFTGKILPFLVVLTAVTMVVGLGWGFFLTPEDARQGATVKIIFIHVPAALMAINAWLMMLVASLIWLIRRHHLAHIKVTSTHPQWTIKSRGNPTCITGVIGVQVGSDNSGDWLTFQVLIKNRVPASLGLVGMQTGINHGPTIIIPEQPDINMI